MSEQSNELTRQIEIEDVEDVEGHVQPPRSDDTDQVRSLRSQ